MLQFGEKKSVFFFLFFYCHPFATEMTSGSASAVFDQVFALHFFLSAILVEQFLGLRTEFSISWVVRK